MINKQDSKLALWNIGVAYRILNRDVVRMLQVFIRNDSLNFPHGWTIIKY